MNNELVQHLIDNGTISAPEDRKVCVNTLREVVGADTMREIVPAKLNGYPVIKIAKHANCATVMVERVDSPHRYVVATWWPELGTTWSWGHYCRERGVADGDFADAERRNRNR